jgi:diguanylate cyclase (GGDEF)-like protein/PAS domain S-box-containing protein
MLDTMERNITDASHAIDSLDQARLEMLLRQSLVAILTNLGVSLLILPVLWTEVPRDYLFLFAAYQMSISIGRLVLLQWIKTSVAQYSPLSSIQACRHEHFIAFGSFFAGLGFGTLSLLLVLDLSLIAQFMIPFVIAGVTAGAIAANVSSICNYVAFILPALLLLVVSLALASMYIPALLVFIYLLLMIVLIRRVNGIFVESINLKGHNVDLVDSLTEHNDELEHLLVKLNDSERLSSNAFNKAGVTMMLVDKDLQIFKVNQEACMLLGYTELQLTSLGLLNLSYANEKAGNHRLFLDLIAGNKQQYHSRKRYVRIDQVDIWVQETVSAVLNDDDEFDYAIVHAQDVTEEYRLTRKLSYQANHDVITGLNNRYAFESRMQQLFLYDTDSVHSELVQHVLCYIDLDQFKVVNDTFGHTVGDTVLREMATIFKKHVRKSDMLSRIGGDEFALLMYDCSIEAAKKQLKFLLEHIRESNFEYEGHLINSTASIGLVTFDQSNTMTEVLKQADSACYAAKEAGRDRLHVYYQDDEAISQRTGEMSWVSRIQRALSEKQFLMYSQEIVQITEADAIPHYELLIRMRDEKGKIIPPGLFLPAAEHYNLASAIDLWVVEHVLSTLHKAKEMGHEIQGVYGVNLSGHSLSDKRFYNAIVGYVNEYDLSDYGAQICFEITETAAILNMTSALGLINELRSMGCLFALDDFGSGLSSYAYLQQMPIDFLKIDGMFVKNCLEDPVKLEMIRSINNIGHVMGIKTIAEFVENDAIFAKLGEIDVDYAQGYWNGPPVPWALAEKVMTGISPIAYQDA